MRIYVRRGSLLVRWRSYGEFTGTQGLGLDVGTSGASTRKAFVSRKPLQPIAGLFTPIAGTRTAIQLFHVRIMLCFSPDSPSPMVALACAIQPLGPILSITSTAQHWHE